MKDYDFCTNEVHSDINLIANFHFELNQFSLLSHQFPKFYRFPDQLYCFCNDI